MTVSTAAGYGSAGFAFIAAVLWLWSAVPALPPLPEGGTIAGKFARMWPVHQGVHAALKKQSGRNAWAAAAAGIAALLQIGSTYTAPEPAAVPCQIQDR